MRLYATVTSFSILLEMGHQPNMFSMAMGIRVNPMFLTCFLIGLCHMAADCHATSTEKGLVLNS